MGGKKGHPPMPSHPMPLFFYAYALMLLACAYSDACIGACAA